MPKWSRSTFSSSEADSVTGVSSRAAPGVTHLEEAQYTQSGASRALSESDPIMPPMPSSSTGGGRAQGPSTFDKWKMGALLGGSVGLIMGFIFGGFNIMRYGAGPNGPMRTLGQYMLGSGATFGFFMSIGSIIRTEGNNPLAAEAYVRARRRPVIMPRHGAKKLGEVEKR